MKPFRIALPIALTIVAAAPAAAAGHDQLAALAAAIDDHDAQDNFYRQQRDGTPITSFGDYSLDRVRREQALRRTWLGALARIDRATLDATDRDSYDIVRYNLDYEGPDEDEYWLTFDLTPYQAPMIIGMINQTLAGRPLTTAAEARDYPRLVGLYATMVDALAAKLDAQVERGIYMPKAELPVVRSTWTSLGAGLSALRPADARLAKLDAATRDRLLADVDAVLANQLKPRFAALIAAIGPDYEAKAPDAVGIGQYPHGKQVYLRLVHRYTTMPTTPEQLRDTGLRDVADIEQRMAQIRAKLGFAGTMRQYYDKISSDPRFLAKSPEQLADIYGGYVRRMSAKLPGYFGTLPKAPYGVHRLPLASEAGQTFGYYSPPVAGEARGLYYFNGSQLDKRSTINAEPIIFHELIPGHHLQIALQRENAALPAFRREAMFGAYNEGWAEYAASLGIELGLYETPEALYGRYVNELFLTARLVVDTGLNYFGWPLEKARAYMHDNSALSDVEIASETLRYGANIPGQALAYHTGFATFWDLRHRAERALGTKFDIREFHDVILLPGARPMSVVAEDVDAYIARKRVG